MAESDDYRLVYDFANVAYLADRDDEACAFWHRAVSLRSQRRRNVCLAQSLIASMRADQWSIAAYDDAVQIITRECKASMSAFSEIPFGTSGQCTIQPKLYNPYLKRLEMNRP